MIGLDQSGYGSKRVILSVLENRSGQLSCGSSWVRLTCIFHIYFFLIYLKKITCVCHLESHAVNYLMYNALF